MRQAVRTVQRWESFGLPVRRMHISVRGAVVAFPAEINAWVKGEGFALSASEIVAVPEDNVESEIQTALSHTLESLSEYRVLQMLRDWGGMQKMSGMKVRAFTCPYCGEVTAVKTPMAYVYAKRPYCSDCGHQFFIHKDVPKKLPQ